MGLLAVVSQAQQTAQYKYHIFEDYALNPAYVGSKDYYSVAIGQDQRFHGLTNSSPQTYFLTLHSRVGEGFLFKKDGKINKFFDKFGNIAMGLQMYQYVFGPLNETNIGFTYGYHLELNQNVLRKNPRHLVLALTPRFKRMGYDVSELFGLEDGGTADFYDPMIEGDITNLDEWIFSADVGALYKTVHTEIGLGALDFVKTINKLESEYVIVNDSSEVSIYEYMYPIKLFGSCRLTFLEVYNSPKFDVTFIPTVTGLYSTKLKSAEYYVDLKLQGVFKEHIAGTRSKVVLMGQLGVNVYQSRIYEPANFIQPYLTLDFANYTIQYAQAICVGSDLTSAKGISSGGQISLLFKISNDRTVRSVK